MAIGQEELGHKDLAAVLAKRITKHFKAESHADASLVVGVFGEWGSGKSNLLQLIHDSDEICPPNTGQAIIVVPFNPWRYEREEHLIVPLLKTTQFVIQKKAKEQQSVWEQLGVVDALKEGTIFLGETAVAFVRAMKFKFGVPGLDAEFSGKDYIDTYQVDKGDTSGPTSAADLESYYYQFDQHLGALTSDKEGKKGIRILFLIDDLDRCLPEKAVEMLESIKLFLDVPGCAFVLALDDEVVERGIVHRYRDYIFQGSGNNLDSKALSQLPITGPEYLEKIINLPFRLPQPTEAEITQLLLKRFPELFANKSADSQTEAQVDVKSPVRSISHGITPESSKLLKLFVRHIPPVPRKHIRAAELIMLMREIINQRGCDKGIKDIPLAKLTLLQLFAPDVYRFGRRRHIGFLRDLQSWTKLPYWGRQGFMQAFRKGLGPLDNESDQAHNNQQQRDIRTFDRKQAPLIEAFEAAAHSRSGFDPYDFISDQPLDEGDLQDLVRYFSLVDEVSPKETIHAEADIQFDDIRIGSTGAESPELVVAPTNVEDFLDLLFSSSAGNWQTAVQRPELKDKHLDTATFDQVMTNLGDKDFQKRLENTEWLSLIFSILSVRQIQLLADTNKTKGFPDTDHATPKPTTVRQWLRHVIEYQALDVEQRAEAGRLLSQLGDPRPGVTLKKDENGAPLIIKHRNRDIHLPDIDWVTIPKGSFLMGAQPEDDEAYEDEKPDHKIELPAFCISRYPVTNAQYRCFVDAGMYEDEAFWKEKLPEAAQQWLKGGAADEALLASISDKDFQKRYRDWLSKDQDRKHPRFWEDSQWNLDNHPVVGISWFEALAYGVWLSELDGVVPDTLEGHTIRLPTEAEWEYAARGKDNLKYAWGKDFDASLGNVSDTGLSRTSVVGAFPPAEVYGLHDMTGNVFEWTQSRWGASLDSPDFAYEREQWDQQHGERNRIDPVEFRVIRGGSWGDDRRFARCSFRLRYFPVNRDFNLGFRLVYSLANPEF